MMFVVKLVIIAYLSLLPIAAWTYRERLSRWLLVAYACPVLLCCLFLTSAWSFILGLWCSCNRWSHAFWKKSSQSFPSSFFN